MPNSQQFFEPQKNIEILTPLIVEITELIKQRMQQSLDPVTTQTAAFYGCAAPKISIEDYLKRFVNYAALEELDLICLLIYLDKYTQRTQDVLNPLNINRLIATIITIQIKNTRDELDPNALYAKLAGVSLNELNRLELTLLQLFGWELVIQPELYLKYKTKVTLIQEEELFTTSNATGVSTVSAVSTKPHTSAKSKESTSIFHFFSSFAPPFFSPNASKGMQRQ